ncbi:hypothetical protein Q5P01_021533 [Channa striata]|uniref:Uncharacterized protein n=1 Tax=Channa striata TaxID=64152 RepID=A0AA88LUU1_CHASR|nr:hypothetical protein Q5P01_021533 [Channa striata]
MAAPAQGLRKEAGEEGRRVAGALCFHHIRSLFLTLGDLGGPFIRTEQLSRALPPPPAVSLFAFCVEECKADQH